MSLATEILRGIAASSARILLIKRLGKYFGYPECCTKSFLERVHAIDTTGKHELTADQEAVHGGTGFIPCQKCAAKIVAGKCTLADLVHDREHPAPFPKQNDIVFLDFVATTEADILNDYEKNGTT